MFPARSRRVCVFFSLYLAALLYESSRAPVPWHPAAGLAFSLLLLEGFAWAPLLVAGASVVSLWVSRPTGSAVPILVDAAVSTACLALAAEALRRWSRVDLKLPRLSDVALVVFVSLLSSLAAAVVVSIACLRASVSYWSECAPLTVNFWLRDAIGIVTMTPAVLVFSAAPEGAARHAVRGFLQLSGSQRLELLGQSVSVAVVLWANFSPGVALELDLYYLLLLPLVWIALRWGLVGASLGVAATNIGASLAIRLFRFAPTWLTELQALMMALPLTGLFLGASVSVRKRAEERLREAKAAAEEANIAKSRFLANASHELRTPLNSILGYSELVLDGVDGPINEAQQASLGRVTKHARVLLDMIDDILDFSGGNPPAQPTEASAFSPRGVIEAVLRQLAPGAKAKGLRLRSEIADSVPDLVYGDADRVRRALIKLGENAVKFTGAGQVLLSLTEQTRGARTAVLHFVVRDTGIGIPADKVAAIFDPFSQVDESATREFEGIGLGLAVASRLVTLLGGRLWVDSDVGVGSAFHFTAPFRLRPSEGETEPPH